jgi:hypothetical protein
VLGVSVSRSVRGTAESPDVGVDAPWAVVAPLADAKHLTVALADEHS